MQNSTIKVIGLQKSYRKLHVLKGVDFEVEKGSVFATIDILSASMWIYSTNITGKRF